MTHWYLEPELASRAEVRERLEQLWRWECSHIFRTIVDQEWFGTEERFEMAEALWAEFYA